MSLFTALYDASTSGFAVALADYGAYPNVDTLGLGNSIYNFPAGFNPTALGSATIQAFADSLEAEINAALTAKLGAGNFTPIRCLASTDGVNNTFIFDNFDIYDNLLFTPGVGGLIRGTVDLAAASLNQVFTLGDFAEMTPTGGNPLQIAGAQRTWTSDLIYRGQFPTNPIP